MAEKPKIEIPRVVLGIAGGSGSGKSWLARFVAAAFPGRTATVCHDWYYKHNGRRDAKAAGKLNFDHPSALETPLLCRHLDDLHAGKAVAAPVYDYATHSRLAETRPVTPRALLVLDGILILGDAKLRERLDLSVFIDVPDDIRLLRRVRRDCTERRVALDETLRLYEDSVRPMHKRYVAPSSRHATWIWSQLEDRTFPDLLIKDLGRRLALGAILLSCFAPPSRGGPFDAARREMLDEVSADAAATASALSPGVIAAMGKVPRHRFVPAELSASAYRNRPLAIGYGQTISQPFIVALMTELMNIKAGDKVLEIGTGSGYQAAVLAEIAKSVYTIEIIEPLGKEASARLKALGCRNVQTRVGDGYYGWPQAAPFDAIMVTAASSHVPPPLIKQLKPGGRMVIPLGTQFMTQALMLVEKQKDGSVTSRQMLPVRFVPLTGGH